jgi:hypothetical protein
MEQPTTMPPPPTFPYTAPALFTMEACCFQCSVRMIKLRVASMIEKLPSGAWEEAVKPRMIMPLMHRLSVMDPMRRMPLLWLESDGLPEACPRHCSMVTLRYWELCRMVKNGPGDDNDTFFLSFHALASNIMHIIVMRESQPGHPDNYTGLWHQISILSGADSIVTELRDIISRVRSGRRIKLEGVVQHIQRCGAVDYALFLADHMGLTIPEDDFRRQALDRMCGGLALGRKREAAKIHTLRMALHPRSTVAGIRVLGPDLLRMCVLQAVNVERIVLWEEVLKKWLEPMVGVKEGDAALGE